MSEEVKEVKNDNTWMYVVGALVFGFGAGMAFQGWRCADLAKQAYKQGASDLADKIGERMQQQRQGRY